MNNTVSSTDFYSAGVNEQAEALRVVTDLDAPAIEHTREMDAIEILVDLAKNGKIDPWNIDIVDVYDKYMLKLIELKANNNLKFAGRALLFASILVKMKSNILEGINALDFEVQEDDFLEDPFEGDVDVEQMQLPSSNVISFDEVLQRRTSTRLNRSRNVTLKDLIRHLEFYEELEKKKALQNTLERQKRRVRNYAKLSASDIKELAHDEYIEQVVEKMSQNLTKILEREEKIELRELTLLGFDKTSAYVAILFLVSREKYKIVQDEFYGKLYVTKEDRKWNILKRK